MKSYKVSPGPRSFAKLLDEWIATFRQQFKTLIPFGFVYTFSKATIVLLFSYFFNSVALSAIEDDFNPGLIIALVVFGLMLVPLVMLAYAILQATATQATRAHWYGEQPQAKAIWKASTPFLGRMLLLQIFIFILVIVSYIGLIIIALIPLLGVLVIFLGLPVIFVFGLLAFAAMNLAFCGIVIEDLGPVQSISRAIGLLFPKGKSLFGSGSVWWRGLVFVVVVAALGWIFSMLAQLPSLIPQWVVAIRNAGVSEFGAQLLPFPVLALLTYISAALEGLFTPLFYVGYPVLYYDLLSRQEGIDLEQRISLLHTTDPTLDADTGLDFNPRADPDQRPME